MKSAKVYFKNKADFLEARKAIKNRMYVLHVDLDEVDPDLLKKGIIVKEEVFGVSESESRTLILWLEENHEEDDFLNSLHDGLKKYRRLTPKQLAALRKAYVRQEGKEP